MGSVWVDTQSSVRVGVLALALVVLVFSALYHEPKPAYTNGSDGMWNAPVEMRGYAWSETIGWISMNCATGGPTGNNICGTSNYKVLIYPDKKLLGYAWSEHVGWVKFGGNLGTTPDGSNSDARIDTDAGKILGWARACAGTAPGNCSTTATHGDGWDGWISLNCSNTPNCLAANYGLSVGDGIIGSQKYAWGSDVVGWVDFSNVTWDKPCTSATSPAACTTDLTGVTTTNQWCETETTACSSNGTRMCTPTPAPAHCVAKDPTGTFSVTPQRVRSGGTATISWDTTFTSACTVTDNHGNSWNDVEVDASGSATSGPTTRYTEYVLNCNNIDGIGPKKVGETQIVNVIPNLIEI